jgi:glycosyltransferase involved in cell wall biosynthesis
MRIAYIAHYQGPALQRQRPSLHNLSLAMKVKLELICELLQRQAHEIEVLSQGEADRYEFRFYPALSETEPFDPRIPVFYTSALPVRFINGFWSSHRLVRLFASRHRLAPFDLVIIHNLKRAHLACASYAMRRLNLPVVLEYEDDSFVDVAGQQAGGFKANYHRETCRRALKTMSGCMAVSPYLLAQLPSGIPKLLLRGVVNDTIVRLNHQSTTSRNNWVVFSGTHEGTQGLVQMITAWQRLGLLDWQLHIAGRGSITPQLEKLAANNPSIIFHGFLSRDENARLLCKARIGMNAQDVTRTPGNVFAFKIIEYLAAGLHVITTPRGTLEPELEAGISYIPENTPEAIATGLTQVMSEHLYLRTAQPAAIRLFGPEAVAQGLHKLVEEVALRHNPSLRKGAPQPAEAVQSTAPQV